MEPSPTRRCPLAPWRPGAAAPAADAVPASESVAAKIQREVVLLLAWGPAILLQLAHPLVAQGVADHSAFRAEQGGRLRRFRHTLEAMLQLCFGTERESRAAMARINAIHDRVHGRLVEAAGVFPAGAPYSAHDPALLAWVHATLLSMNVRVYELYVADLAPGEKDRYCAEASAIEGPLGIPEGRLPRSFGELRGYMDAMLARGEVVVTDTARQLAHAVLYPPVPRVAGAAIWLMRLPGLGLLPPSIRRAYGFPWGPADETRLRLVAGLSRRLLPWTPPPVRYWPAARAALRGTHRSRARAAQGRGRTGRVPGRSSC